MKKKNVLLCCAVLLAALCLHGCASVPSAVSVPESAAASVMAAWEQYLETQDPALLAELDNDALLEALKQANDAAREALLAELERRAAETPEEISAFLERLDEDAIVDALKQAEGPYREAVLAELEQRMADAPDEILAYLDQMDPEMKAQILETFTDYMEKLSDPDTQKAIYEKMKELADSVDYQAYGEMARSFLSQWTPQP